MASETESSPKVAEPGSAVAATEQESSPKATAAQRTRRVRYRPRGYEIGALVLAVIFAWISLTPTLLPRGPLFQGVVTGGSAAFGYLIGVVITFVARKALSPREFGRNPGQRAWLILAVVVVVVSVPLVVWYESWQDELRTLMEVSGLRWWAGPATVAVAVIVFVGLVGLCRLWLEAARWTGRRLGHVAPPRVSAAVAVVIVAVVTVLLVNAIVTRGIYSMLDSSFQALNDEHNADSPAPEVSQRSGGPGSLVTWDSLGRQGRIWVGNGPTVAELTEFSGRPGTQPIRAYVGLDSADDVEAEAALAVRELERAGGFDRAVLGVVTTTGSGWINESSASALEYMFGGDTALVSMQYSYLPSWLSFLVDQDRARDAGRVLFDAVHAKWETLPSDNRPQLVVFGESLGSFGGESAFDDAAELAARTNGALFVGPPNSNVLWSRFTEDRESGTPEWLPIYADGKTVRFVARPADLDRPTPDWPRPRVVYLQHPSDPITWWTPNLIYQQPDWLREERGYDVLPSTRWFPFVTFLQVSADMAVSNSVPEGHGHTFRADLADAWAAILEPAGWTSNDTARLRGVLLGE